MKRLLTLLVVSTTAPVMAQGNAPILGAAAHEEDALIQQSALPDTIEGRRESVEQRTPVVIDRQAPARVPVPPPVPRPFWAYNITVSCLGPDGDFLSAKPPVLEAWNSVTVSADGACPPGVQAHIDIKVLPPGSPGIPGTIMAYPPR